MLAFKLEVVPRSLHCATAHGAVAPVGMTGLGDALEGGAEEKIGPLRSG